MIAGASTLETPTVGFTPTQQRMLKLLSDGMPHSKEAMLECLQDELCGPTDHARHIAGIRMKIRLKGEDIICEYVKRRPYYRHVRLLPSAYDGRY